MPVWHTTEEIPLQAGTNIRASICFRSAIKQCRNNFIVIDNADCLINDDVRRFINFELSNQYMLFLQNCDGLNVSDKSFKVLKFDNYRITLAEEL